MFPFALVVLFLLRIKFPPHKSLTSIILERYDYEGLSSLRTFEKTDYKLRKVSCDVEFLQCCITNDLIPKFLNFNLYSQDVRGDNDYRSYQKHLLDNELQNKRDCKTALQLELQSATDKLKNLFTSFDFNHVMSVINNGNNHKISDVKNTQNRKLFDLGLSHSFENLSHFQHV